MTQRERKAWNAAKNRGELIEAGFSRRNLVKMGLLTGAGYLVAKGGLNARADEQTQLGPLTLRSVIVLGNPFRFTKDNIDQFNF